MRTRLLYFTFYYLCFILYFIFVKILFLLFYYQQSFALGIAEWFGIILHGFRLDLSAASYIMLFPALVIMLTTWVRPTILLKILKIYTWIVVILINILVVTDLEIFKYWGFRLDTAPLMYLNTPKEMLINVPAITYLKQLGLAAILTVLFILVINKKVFPLISKKINDKILTSILFGLLFFALIIPIRGGLGVSTNNTGSVYYHSNPFVNQAALNVPWNVGYSLSKLQSKNNPYQFFSQNEAGVKISVINNNLNKKCCDTTILKVKRPNILLIILESFTSKVIGINNTGDEITPHFNSLCKEGIFFSNFYASGDRSDKAMPAIFSAFPSMPTESIIKHPAKTQNLPNITKELKKVGYSTAFYYGGDINFANFKSFFINSGFEKITCDIDFDPSLRTSKWGVPDEFVFNKFKNDIQNAKQPFFYSMFSLSSHDPFDIPNQTCTDVNNRDLRFINSLKYTDACLGDFIDNLKQNKLWDNTLIIIMADHGNIQPGSTANSDTLSFKIPMLWLGGALSFKDTVNSNYLSQVDLASILFRQLNMPDSGFSWSNPNKSYATYAYRQGIGFISNDIGFTYFRDNDSATFCKGSYSQPLVDMVKARYQLIYEEFLKR